LRMASTGIRNNSKLYIPYSLAGTVTVMMFYLLCFMTDKVKNADMLGSAQLSVILTLGIIVVGIFSFVIVLYTNSFLMKQRKKELGLFNILGMEKKHIGRLMTVETLLVGGGSMIAGLLTGILFSRLLLAIVLRIVRVDVPFKFSVSVTGIVATLALFGVIYFIALAYNLGRVHLSNPITLLRAQNAGEKEPKTKWILAVVSTALLAAGYYIALTVKEPLSALTLFFIAVLLVIAGTYGMMTTGSIVFLKALRKNKKYYYRTNHFISVSSMMYRMKQNAVGLASICILSTMVLVMLSTTVCLYVGTKGATEDSSPRSIQVQGSRVTQEDIKKIDQTMDSFILKNDLKTNQTAKYQSLSWYMKRDGSAFIPQKMGYEDADIDANVMFIPLKDYNQRTGLHLSLHSGQALLFTRGEAFAGGKADFSGYTVEFVKGELDPQYVVPNEAYNNVPLYFIIVSNVQEIEKINDVISHDPKLPKNSAINGMDYYYGFNLNVTDEKLNALTAQLDLMVRDFPASKDSWIDASSIASLNVEYLTVYGGLFFVGIFLGIMFTMATILIMYYKQISEGYDDRNRFEIMQKVGLDKSMVRGAIRSQVLTVFFLPLLAACVHIGFAFNMISKMLGVLHMSDWHLFAITTGCTVLVFGAIYTLAYTLTARAYYRIVE